MSPIGMSADDAVRRENVLAIEQRIEQLRQQRDAIDASIRDLRRDLDSMRQAHAATASTCMPPASRQQTVTGTSTADPVPPAPLLQEPSVTGAPTADSVSPAPLPSSSQIQAADHAPEPPNAGPGIASDQMPPADDRLDPGEPLEDILGARPPTRQQQGKLRRIVVTELLQQERFATRGLCFRQLWRQIPEGSQEQLFEGKLENCATYLRKQRSRQSGRYAWLRVSSEMCKCELCTRRTGARASKYTLLSVFPRAWSLFSLEENEQVVTAWRSLSVVDARQVEKISSGVFTLTLAASRQVLLNRKDIEGRSASEVQSGTSSRVGPFDPDDNNNPATPIHIVVKFPLHAGSDTTVLALLTLRYFATQDTISATKKWERRLGGEFCTSFLLRQMYACRTEKKDQYQKLDLYKIIAIRAVIGGLYVGHDDDTVPATTKRRRTR